MISVTSRSHRGAFVGALIITRSVRKDTDQYHSRAAFGTGRTSDNVRGKSGISHFVPPATWLSAALRFSAGRAIIVTHIVHRIHAAIEMGFNRRKLEEQRLRPQRRKRPACARPIPKYLMMLSGLSPPATRGMPSECRCGSRRQSARPLQRDIDSCGYAAELAGRSMQLPAHPRPAQR